MDALAGALLSHVEAVGARTSPPPVHSFELAPDAGADGRRNNFGFLRLVDGSIGLTYVALDGALRSLARELPGLSLPGRSPLELLAHYAASGPDAGWRRALGLAAINAVSRHAPAPDGATVPMPGNLERLDLRPGERVGMVGHFGRLVGPLRERGIPLTVLELDARLVVREPGFEVTLDPARLAGCVEVIVTGTTLLNHTLGRLLPHCAGAREVHLLGPSASCLPGPLFDAGVTRVGGFRVTDPELFTARWRAGGRWRDAGERYLVSRPGIDREAFAAP